MDSPVICVSLSDTLNACEALSEFYRDYSGNFGFQARKGFYISNDSVALVLAVRGNSNGPKAVQKKHCERSCHSKKPAD
ncbi:KLTH0F01474p [Lachancea thermotolerans CBS 6340]|uniref:KLTH0F01474p n=1 Tax=Lachancea thermotolerans (strain ATCC 56472 / CBS 6340 / NRRL Y-8284) TaxID=559295 RepID=C5DK36_LACTC|nr:KLTH0F01474p [Lachancea thermotolerans CBS 6340]CAR23837.1 KLTH0F01474p [Lachancea thermotolerans CBS 6340]